MVRFKQFVGTGEDLDRQVNDWLEEFEPDVMQMVQTVELGTITISFLYAESFRGQERRLASEHGVSDASDAARDLTPDAPIIVPQEPGQPTPDAP